VTAYGVSAWESSPDSGSMYNVFAALIRLRVEGNKCSIAFGVAIKL
jgi:hypothetical protein